VHTPRLTAWVLGTVFGVMTREEVSDVFVFKGKVQVTDAEGEGRGVCVRPERVRGDCGERCLQDCGGRGGDPASFSFPSAAMRRRRSPAAALGVATRIADWWVAHYLPEEAWRIRERLPARPRVSALPSGRLFGKRRGCGLPRPYNKGERYEDNKRCGRFGCSSGRNGDETRRRHVGVGGGGTPRRSTTGDGPRYIPTRGRCSGIGPPLRIVRGWKLPG
jgi:hypothetical protein